MRVHSGLWLDQPDAHQRVDARRAARTLSAAEAEKLHGFVDDGYVTMSLDVDKPFCDTLDSELAELWQRRPADLAVSPPGPGRPTSFPDYDGPIRARGYRIPDLHSHSACARDLYLHAALFRMVELIFDQPALAFQSLYFEYGSTQSLHRDPMFVATRPPLNLCAAWIALEDITADSGPLAYVPRSHRLPWFEFERDNISCGQSVSPQTRAEGAAWLQETLAENGLQRRAFTCKQGDAFIWHAGLVHGGDAIHDPDRTRKSLVVHYSTAADYTVRTARMQVRDGGEWQTVARTTGRILEKDGARGLENPLRDEVAHKAVRQDGLPRGLARLRQRANRLRRSGRPT